VELPSRERAADHLPFEVEVEATASICDAILEVQLRARSSALPEWSPGSHIDVIFEPGLERQYSLCGVVSNGERWTIAILRERNGRGGSEYAHTKLSAGKTLQVRGPRNNFPLVTAASYLFIAGGIGVTPLIPMVAACEAAACDWRLVYGGRARRSMAYRDALAQYGTRVALVPEDECGPIDVAMIVGDLTSNTAVYCCGPSGLIDAVSQALAGRADVSMHVERFQPIAPAGTSNDQSFEVVLRQSGLTIVVPSGVSILEALDTAGIEVPSSCREGTCGTCETVVLEGKVDHRDSVLSPEERESNTSMMLCCSRARSARLKLDL
jgi:ferredoxin-NADP reductase